MKKSIYIIIILFFTIVLVGVGCGKENWQGVYYPDGCLVCEDDYIFSPIYRTKEKCLNWAIEIKEKRNNVNDLYECGKNCEWESGFMVCEETVD